MKLLNIIFAEVFSPFCTLKKFFSFGRRRWKKDVKTLKNMILILNYIAKYQFAGQNTQATILLNSWKWSEPVLFCLTDGGPNLFDNESCCNKLFKKVFFTCSDKEWPLRSIHPSSRVFPALSSFSFYGNLFHLNFALKIFCY